MEKEMFLFLAWRASGKLAWFGRSPSLLASLTLSSSLAEFADGFCDPSQPCLGHFSSLDRVHDPLLGAFGQPAEETPGIRITVEGIPEKESSSEELNQHRGNHRRGDLVRLALQGAMLTVGKRLRQRYCCRIHERE